MSPGTRKTNRRYKLGRSNKTFQPPALGPTTADLRRTTGHLTFPVRVTTRKPVFILADSDEIDEDENYPYAHKPAQKSVVKLLIQTQLMKKKVAP